MRTGIQNVRGRACDRKPLGHVFDSSRRHMSHFAYMLKSFLKKKKRGYSFMKSETTDSDLTSPTSGGAALRSKLVDELCQIQTRFRLST